MSNEHKTRFSDSSLYDEVCTVCGATDAMGDRRLHAPCPGSEADRLSDHIEATAKDTQQLLIAAEAELASAKAQIVALETLRPMWAEGWTSDSMAAQASATALAQIWAFLGASNQTEAMAKLRGTQEPFSG